MKAQVNLIPWNAVPGLPFETPTPAQVRAFTEVLEKAGLTAVQRMHRGRGVMGACGYNATSRHIAYAGGVAADGTTPCDTRTPQQKSALEHYVRDFVARFPGAAVVGHNELAAKACPSFDVQAWLRETGIL